jgi:5-methylcytosine-specific restriction endonuclease McrA
MNCAYCGTRRAVHRDHVVPKSHRRRSDLPDDLRDTVPSCFDCNIRKGARKLVPVSWADRIPLLQEYIPGPWRVWDGDPKSPAFTAVHK